LDELNACLECCFRLVVVVFVLQVCLLAETIQVPQTLSHLSLSHQGSQPLLKVFVGGGGFGFRISNCT
jgi:hypothetical protein